MHICISDEDVLFYRMVKAEGGKAAEYKEREAIFLSYAPTFIEVVFETKGEIGNLWKDVAAEIIFFY